VLKRCVRIVRLSNRDFELACHYKRVELLIGLVESLSKSVNYGMSEIFLKETYLVSVALQN